MSSPIKSSVAKHSGLTVRSALALTLAVVAPAVLLLACLAVFLTCVLPLALALTPVLVLAPFFLICRFGFGCSWFWPCWDCWFGWPGSWLCRCWLRWPWLCWTWLHWTSWAELAGGAARR